ncbi:MAG: DedA family protein, partial [Thermonemataceae bacterium]|nr:DedA family protein [Thermonemataceae bacterium]
LMDSKELIQTGGLLLITLIVYLETGWFFGFFLPGDYLLFLSGMLCDVYLGGNIFVIFGSIFGAAVLGNFSGYAFGKIVGRNFENRKETWYFKKKYIENTRSFFDKNGGKALVIGRFLPIIRTFAPLLAGMARMPLVFFALYNLIGAFLWSGVLVLGGYYLGKQFPQLIHYVEYVIFFFLAITTVTVIKSYLNIRKEQKQKDSQQTI